MCASIRTVRFISRPRARFTHTHTQKFERDPEREGTWGCLHWYPKFYNNVFLFVGLTTLGTFIDFDFDWLR